MTLHIDRSQELRMLAAYTPKQVNSALQEAAQAGAQAAVVVVKLAAPVGASNRPSQFYRLHGYNHGTLRASVQSAAIGNTPGQVIGPMGDQGWARVFVSRRTGWPAKMGSLALSVAQRASEAVLAAYVREH